ncbi:MAG: cytochrome c biogenesis protein CcsA, partial [Planctomycetota bacterium]
FPFMTAALCMGALWADDSWGTYWFWDAKETWALISWAFFLIYFHVRFVRGWVGLRAQLLVLGGGLMILITYVLIHVLPASQASLHVYN